MVFTHDTEVALQAAAALVNTLDDGVEHLPDADALAAFVDEWGWTGDQRRDQAELDSVRALRPRLREVWTVDRDEVVVIVNGMLREAQAVPQLVKHDDWDYHIHATPAQAPLSTRMAVEAAMALSDVVRADELSRLRTCAADDCENVVIDLSKNRSKRYCEAGCGNRAAVAAYRARKVDGAAVR
jgi:predicted RNA-binding Zn ribbon-like protein